MRQEFETQVTTLQLPLDSVKLGGKNQEQGLLVAGLLRIILINTHLKGVVELKLDQHSNICGTNASGKTTLQRLIPVFYGEYPSRVVPSTRDSFENWYLPQEASYISYEYQRYNGDICQVILSSSREEQGLKYRLVNKAFELEDFIKERQQQEVLFHTPKELQSEFRKLGLSSSRYLNTREYRAIIQNDRSLQNSGSNQSQLRALARQYTLSDPRHSLRHMEKLAKAVHSKEGKMETIKSMIAAILEEDGVELRTTWVDANKAQAWLEDSRLIQQFEAIRPQFQKLEQAHQQLQQHETRLLGLKQHLAKDEESLDAARDHLELSLNTNRAERKSLDSKWTSQRDELNQALSKAKADSQNYDQRLNAIEDEYDKWQQSDIEKAKTNLDKLPSRREELQSVSAQHQLLTEQHSDIEAAYNARKNDINEALLSTLSRLNQNKDQIATQLSQERRSELEQMHQLEGQYHTQIEKLKQALLEQQHKLQLEQASLETQMAQMGFTDQETIAIRSIQNRLDEVRKQQDQHRAQADSISAELQAAKSERLIADKQLKQCSQVQSQAEQQLQQIQHQLNPESDTVLAFLRDELPGWEQHLARVINPELLSRKDLKPELAPQLDDSAFGLVLDYKSIDLPSFAVHEATLQQRLSEAQTALELAKNKRNLAEKSLAQAHSLVRQHEQSFAETRATSQRIDEELTRIAAERQILNEQAEQALHQRRAKERDSLESLKISQQQIQQNYEQNLAELEQQHQENKLERMAWWQDKIGVLEDQKQQNDEQIQNLQRSAKADLKQAEAWYRSELKDQGLDDGNIIKLAQRRKQLIELIQATEQRRDEVLEYNDWFKRVWQQQKLEVAEELSIAKSALSQAKNQLQSQTQIVTKQRNELGQQASELELSQQNNNLELSRCQQLLKRLSGEEFAKLIAELDETERSVAERLRETEQLLTQRERLLKQIEDEVKNYDQLIAQRAGSQFGETWELSRAKASYTTELGTTMVRYRDLVPELAYILNDLVPQNIAALVDYGHTLGMNINDFYHNLLDIDKRIVSQSRRITQEIGEDLSLDGVSGSAVQIRSKISELEFWDELKAFVAAYEQWREQGFNQLPEEDYAILMKRALEIIGRSALKDGISKLLQIELRLREGNSDLVIRTDRQLNESSSHGMAYLILCKFLLAFTRLLRGNADVYIHWPIDELGTLHQSNVKKIFDACDTNKIRILGAFPNPESEVLQLFTHRYIIDREKRQLQTVQPKVNSIEAKLKAKQQSQEQAI
ncbi:ATP-binding protein [Alginatibacterium sediminis]|uniref:ATP-binding protein n=1 Tax=Alginatibacterium sediminis TaxID=2164068 RepID=A0A420EJP3_9ALTE|nr:ATP-binding protein [Alginatibacterium sediminis]RKF20884.1 ATP-binding protein [Alginatibacterium sediminis]